MVKFFIKDGKRPKPFEVVKVIAKSLWFNTRYTVLATFDDGVVRMECVKEDWFGFRSVKWTQNFFTGDTVIVRAAAKGGSVWFDWGVMGKNGRGVDGRSDDWLFPPVKWEITEPREKIDGVVYI